MGRSKLHEDWTFMALRHTADSGGEVKAFCALWDVCTYETRALANGSLLLCDGTACWTTTPACLFGTWWAGWMRGYTTAQMVDIVCVQTLAIFCKINPAKWKIRLIFGLAVLCREFEFSAKFRLTGKFSAKIQTILNNFITEFPHIPESPWKYLNFFILNSRPCKYLKTGQVFLNPWIHLVKLRDISNFVKQVFCLQQFCL